MMNLNNVNFIDLFANDVNVEQIEMEALRTTEWAFDNMQNTYAAYTELIPLLALYFNAPCKIGVEKTFKQISKKWRDTTVPVMINDHIYTYGTVLDIVGSCAR